MVAGMVEKANIQCEPLPEVPKSHDDLLLRPPCEEIGERPCINGEKCLARFIAQVRYGRETDLAFTCTEFLLPDQRRTFLDGRGLPARHGKCLLCMRYFQVRPCPPNFPPLTLSSHATARFLAELRLHHGATRRCLPFRVSVSHPFCSQARTDPNFKVGSSPLGMQVFCNPVGGSHGHFDEDQAQDAAKTLPTHCSTIAKRDGYKPSAMLFVDEDWAALRSGRESQLGKLLFRPVVKFCSTHYQYVKDEEGVHIVQTGVGADDVSDGLFVPPPAATVAPPGASAPTRR